MSAAMEASIEKYSQYWFSLLDYRSKTDFSAPTIYARKINKTILSQGVGQSIFIECDFPSCSQKEITGIKLCKRSL